jgi:hypothetical protein
MASPILALQQARQDPYAHVAHLLPRALMIATKLGLDAFRVCLPFSSSGYSEDRLRPFSKVAGS